ncbi:hypothetical protein [Sporosarcina sp. FSL K6-2383]|uniref:hypothetical protein n=1 Tax=Sporosarcina sp. FSL K6-2383 TaxID=2921556 RepID=UPI003159C0AB
MAYDAKTDWQYNETPTEADANRWEQGIEDAHDEIETHKADLAYQKAGGTASAITLTTQLLTDGYAKTFIASANNGGAATTINGKPLYKPNTTAAPTLIAGKAYTVWYNLASNCFFIKASAEGTATTAQVLAGVPFSNEFDTGLIGTMPNRGAINQTITTQNGQSIIPAGYHNGAGKVTAAFANLIAGNVKQGVNIGGVVGTAATIMPGGFNVYEMSGAISAPSPNNVLIFALTISVGGLYRIGFNLFNQLNIAPDRIMVAQIYRNSTPHGTVRKTANGNTNPMRFTEDLLFNNGDSMRIYVSAEGPGSTILNVSEITLSTNLGFNRTT